MRVKINPVCPSTVFFWRQTNNKQMEDKYINYSCAVTKEEKKHILKMKDIAK
jgi:hypothetical protein